MEIERNIGRQLFDASSELRANEAPAAKLSEMLYKGQQAKEFTEFNPFVVASAIRAVIDSAAFYVASHPEADMDLTIREVAALFDRATRKPHGNEEGQAAN